ncbi:hypothetical protein BJY52DRAFT_306779 [Lactarius psammicola]|nr:hypothetical protein BJY52DRAFT_306779 [Lactarius psammicola]
MIDDPVRLTFIRLTFWATGPTDISELRIGFIARVERQQMPLDTEAFMVDFFNAPKALFLFSRSRNGLSFSYGPFICLILVFPWFICVFLCFALCSHVVLLSLLTVSSLMPRGSPCSPRSYARSVFLPNANTNNQDHLWGSFPHTLTSKVIVDKVDNHLHNMLIHTMRER